MLLQLLLLDILASSLMIGRGEALKPLPHETCEVQYQKLGCFHQDDSLQYLFSDRNPVRYGDKPYERHLVDWRHWHAYLHSLACRCKRVAKSQGFSYFALRFYGLCYGADSPPNQHRSNGHCSGNVRPKENCDHTASNECVGRMGRDYFYKIGKRVRVVNGGWTKWSSYGPCTKSCGNGFQIYVRYCTEPAPSGGGKCCAGPAITKRRCNLSVCPGHGYGETRDTAEKTCRDIKQKRPAAQSGVYWLKLKSNTTFQVYCDQTTDGGGWTLVYSYGFTNYGSFMSGSNAVSPRPNWPVTTSNVPISTTPPLREYGLGAMAFERWKQIGREVLIKSDINNWYGCKPGSGSLVDWRAGSLICRNLKTIVSLCTGKHPQQLKIRTCGPSFDYSSHFYSLFYFFEGSTVTRNWPTHDPCGTNALKHKKGVVNPGGNLFIR